MINKGTKKGIIYTALSMLKNYTETGNPLLDKEIMIQCCQGNKDMQRVVANIPKLTEEQKRYVSDIEQVIVEIKERFKERQ